VYFVGTVFLLKTVVYMDSTGLSSRDAKRDALSAPVLASLVTVLGCIYGPFLI